MRGPLILSLAVDFASETVGHFNFGLSLSLSDSLSETR